MSAAGEVSSTLNMAREDDKRSGTVPSIWGVTFGWRSCDE